MPALQFGGPQSFRNLAAVALAPSPRATVLVGANGQGKTNLLEAVHYLTTLEALRVGRLPYLVRFATPVTQVAGDLGPGGPAGPRSG